MNSHPWFGAYVGAVLAFYFTVLGTALTLPLPFLMGSIVISYALYVLWYGKGYSALSISKMETMRTVSLICLFLPSWMITIMVIALYVLSPSDYSWITIILYGGVSINTSMQYFMSMPTIRRLTVAREKNQRAAHTIGIMMKKDVETQNEFAKPLRTKRPNDDLIDDMVSDAMDEDDTDWNQRTAAFAFDDKTRFFDASTIPERNSPSITTDSTSSSSSSSSSGSDSSD